MYILVHLSSFRISNYPKIFSGKQLFANSPNTRIPAILTVVKEYVAYYLSWVETTL